MLGDVLDFVSRLTAVLPKRWFGDQTPNLLALLGAIATPWSWLYSLIDYTKCQSRISTASDGWLDLAASDYFGSNLIRNINESDVQFRVRILAGMLPTAGTRSALSAQLQNLTGIAPAIFEPANCLDTGSYGEPLSTGIIAGGGMAYGQAGGWGSLALPYQLFVTATRPATPGVGMLGGYGCPAGGYGVGESSYVNLELLPGNVTETDIQTAVCRLLPVNAVAWLRII